MDLTQPLDELNELLDDYQNNYNWERVHGSTGVTPAQRHYDRLSITPYTDEVLAGFDPAAEQERHRFFGLEWWFEEDNNHRNGPND